MIAHAASRIPSLTNAPRPSRFCHSENSNCDGCNVRYYCTQVGKYPDGCPAGGNPTEYCGGTCTNAAAGEYYTGASSTTADACGVAACTNAVAGQYYTSAGGTSAPTSAAECSVAACTNALAGKYYTGNGGLSATGCAVAACTNAVAGQYYTGAGGASATGCAVATCTIAADQFYTSAGGAFAPTSKSECTVSNCISVRNSPYQSSSKLY